MSASIIDLYLSMYRIRRVEEVIAQEYAQQQMRCPVHLSIGQEAVAAGVCACLSSEDYAVSGHRSHAHYLAKGGSLNRMIAEIYGKATGCCGGKGGSMHLVDLSAGFLGAVPIVGSTIPIGVGVALAERMKKRNRLTVVFHGEGSTEEGVFHESVNFAALWKLPVLFICENNLYSVYSPMEVRQPSRSLDAFVSGYGITAFSADGNDVEEVQKVTQSACDQIRSGKGPVFIEFKTYRWREHCGPGYDNHIGYRTEEEFELWKKRCPLNKIEKKLLTSGVDSNQTESRRAQIENEILKAFEEAKQAPFPELSEMGQPLYA